MATAVDAVPAPHIPDGAVSTADDAPPPSFLDPATALVCVAASALVSEALSYYASLPIYLALFARAVWPDRVDAVLVPLGAGARRAALLARADLEADLRRLLAHRATAPLCAAAEACARRARDAVDGATRRVEAKWAEHSAAAGTAWFLLRLAGRAARIAATVVLDAAREEVTAQAPSVIAYLKGAVLGIRKGENEEEEDGDNAGFEFRDVVSLVGIAFYLLFCFRFIVSFNTMQFCGASLVVMCGLAVLIVDWIDPPDDDDDDSDDTDRTTDAADDATQPPPEGDDAGEATLEDAMQEVRESWQIMHLMIFFAFCFDVFLLHVRFGPQPIVLLLLALCNFEVLNIGKDIQLAPDNDEQGAAEGSAVASAAGVVDEAVDRWRSGAVWVFGASSVKVFVIYLVIDFYMAASSFLLLCIMADLLLNEEDSLVELYGSGDDEDKEEGSAASGDDVKGCVEEGTDEASVAQHSDTSSSEDEEEDYVLEEHRYSSDEHYSNTTPSEDEEEDYVLEEHSSEEHSNDTNSSEDEEEDDQVEHCDRSEEHEHLEEQGQQEEQESSRGSSIDDGWDLVEADLEMTVKDETDANRKSSSFLPWK